MAWKEPKTDWTADDRFNIQDYNRIKNNLEYLHARACMNWGEFEIENMGKDIETNDYIWEVKYFNAFEGNVDKINQNIFPQDYGFRQTFYQNGIFIGYAELNRIESATLGMKNILDGAEAGKVRISFRLGGPKGLKV